MKVSVVGAGYVGLVTAVGLAQIDHNVMLMDQDLEKVKQISEGRAPFFEPGLDTALMDVLRMGQLRATDTLEEAVHHSEVIFICVGTPANVDGSADLFAVDALVRGIAGCSESYKCLVEKSTVPAGTWRRIDRTLGLFGSQTEFDVASNPEFLREGSALYDFAHPDRIVIGVESERARNLLTEVYEPISVTKVVTNIATAELIKHASNAFLATKISFINMVSDLCERVGADVRDVAKGVGLDSRIGSRFLQAGAGYGGSCFPKDVKALCHIASVNGLDFSLLAETERINADRIGRIYAKISDALWVPRDKTVAVLGLAFKPDTDDVREAPSSKLISRLLEEGSRVRVYDPKAATVDLTRLGERLGSVTVCQNALEAATGAHMLVLMTEWQEFMDLDFVEVRSVMTTPLIVDARNAWADLRLSELGFEYSGMGIPTSAKRAGIES